MPDREGKSNRGFASMDEEKQREIASKGGRAAHQKGTAHEFDSDEARAAGRKGGEMVSRNRAHMSEIGRKGGEARGAAARAGRTAARASNGANADASASSTDGRSPMAAAKAGQRPGREGSTPVEVTDERTPRAAGGGEKQTPASGPPRPDQRGERAGR
ncbi:MAG: hypothetical protein NVS9B3_11730 [Gemmatimonadaceae bacterium]